MLKNVTVTFDYPSQSGERPKWTVSPDTLVVPHGEVDTIEWGLQAQNLPQGTIAWFDEKPILFNECFDSERRRKGALWQGPSPERVPGVMTIARVVDNNTGNEGEKHYFYLIRVQTIGPDGTTLYTYDPEVDNKGG